MVSSNWQQKQRELCTKLVEYLTKKNIKSTILSDGKKPYVRIFFGKKIHYDCYLKAVKSEFAQNVWIVPKMFFNRDVYYIVYVEKKNYFYIMSGLDVEKYAKQEMSTYEKKLIYLVVAMSGFIPIHAWIKRREVEAEKRLQRRITDFK